MTVEELNRKVEVARILDADIRAAFEEELRKRRVGVVKRLILHDTYLEWLRGFLEKGGKITHFYNYPSSRWDWHVASRDLEIEPAYGAKSFCLIVPEDIIVQGDRGHSCIYFMKDYTHLGIVPAFSDTIFK